MKTEKNVVTVHKQYDNGEPLYFTTKDGIKVKTMSKLEPFLESLEKGTTVRVTNAGVIGLGIVETMNAFELIAVTAHWHATGLDKGLEAEPLTLAFHNLDAMLFKPVSLREDLAKLKGLVAVRQALIDNRKQSQLKLIAATRSLGFGDTEKENLPEYLSASKLELAEVTKRTETPIEREITKLAKTIPECVILNEVLGIRGDAWMTSAAVVAYIGDIARFGSVSSLWHYSGQHVIDGRAPKRAKGVASTWNPKLRTVLWTWCDSMLKVKNPTWRSVYDEYRNSELLVHELKCTKCAGLKCGTEAQAEKKRLVIQSHSGARARRRVTKDVLKSFFLRMQQPTKGTLEPKVEMSVAVAA